MPKKFLIITISMIILLSACSPATAPTEVMIDEPTETMMDEHVPTEVMMEKPTETMADSSMDDPTWFGATFINVNTNQQFRISDYKGKVILVETLAMWCSNCKKQQEQVKELHELLGTDSDLVSIGLDIDPNEVADDLKNYVTSNGFDWIYAIASVDVINEISDLYGAQFLNPPSTPMLVIDRKGEVHPLPFGIKSADDLMKFIEPFLSESL